MRGLVLSIGIMITGACNMQAPAGHVPGTPDLQTQQLIHLCIDTTLALDPGLNSDRYQVDFSRVKAWNQSDIKQALLHRPAQQTNLDSIQHHDSTWLKYGYLETPVIRIEAIDSLPDNKLRIHTFKLKASDGAIEVEIVVRRTGDHFECLGRQIVRIS